MGCMVAERSVSGEVDMRMFMERTEVRMLT